MKAMAPHSSTFAWKIPWMEEPGGLQFMGSLELETTERLHFHFSSLNYTYHVSMLFYFNIIILI